MEQKPCHFETQLKFTKKNQCLKISRKTKSIKKCTILIAPGMKTMKRRSTVLYFMVMLFSQVDSPNSRLLLNPYVCVIRLILLLIRLYFIYLKVNFIQLHCWIDKILCAHYKSSFQFHFSFHMKSYKFPYIMYDVS